MSLNNPNLHIISGGPGSGKTTVLRELGRRGYRCAEEVARAIIRQQIETRGRALPWDDREAFTYLMLERSVASYLANTPAALPVFSDRGIPDTLCYARLIGMSQTGSIESACREYRCAPLVFMAPPWQEIYHTDGERKQDFAEASLTYEQMTDVYRQCEYRITELPRQAPAARAEFILTQLQLPSLAPHS